jgi:hypothetical protein
MTGAAALPESRKMPRGQPPRHSPANREFTTVATTPKFPDDFPENREWFREFAKFHPSGFVVAVGAGTEVNGGSVVWVAFERLHRACFPHKRGPSNLIIIL